MSDTAVSFLGGLAGGEERECEAILDRSDVFHTDAMQNAKPRSCSLARSLVRARAPRGILVTTSRDGRYPGSSVATITLTGCFRVGRRRSAWGEGSPPAPRDAKKKWRSCISTAPRFCERLEIFECSKR